MWNGSPFHSPHYIRTSTINKPTKIQQLWAAACVAYQGKTDHCCFSDGLHPSHMQPTLPKSNSRTHLCCEDELTDDVCCVLTPIGEPHDLRDSFAANPIICGERWQRLN